MDDPSTTTFGRMGEILVVKGFITAEQLEEALASQEKTGRLLGEICVEKFGLDRFAIADALSEQWGEHPPAQGGGPAMTQPRVADGEVQELRILLAEAEAGQARLAWRTDALERRLAAVEALVSGNNGSARNEADGGASASHARP